MQIQSARVISIFFMTYAHVSPGIVEADLANRDVRGVDFLFLFLGSLVAKSAVPLLSVLSGWLLYDALNDRPFHRVIVGKMRTLLMPMIFWNALLLVLIVLYVLATGAETWLPQNEIAVVNSLFSLTGPPANIQLAFLRDLFVCVVLSPIILWAGRRSPFGLLVLLAVAAIFVPATLLILRLEIAFFFAIGLLLRANAINLSWVDRAGTHLAFAFGLTGTVLLYLQMQQMAGSIQVPQPILNALVIAVRLTAALYFWWAAGYLLRTRLAPLIGWAGGFVFVVFCSHVILFKAMSLIGRDIVGGYYGDWYLVYFLVQPFLAFIFGWAILRTCQAFAPFLVPTLLGARRYREQTPPLGAPPLKG